MERNSQRLGQTFSNKKPNDTNYSWARQSTTRQNKQDGVKKIRNQGEGKEKKPKIGKGKYPNKQERSSNT